VYFNFSFVQTERLENIIHCYRNIFKQIFSVHIQQTVPRESSTKFLYFPGGDKGKGMGGKGSKRRALERRDEKSGMGKTGGAAK